MTDCANFYELRDRRTKEYLQGDEIGIAPLHVAIDAEAADSRPGQLALLSIANQLARVHRQISFDLPDPNAPVLVPIPFEGTTLGETLLGLVTTIDPCGKFVLRRRPPRECVSIGLGQRAGSNFTWYLGANRSIARLARTPVPFASDEATLRGAGLAACLGAAAAFRAQIGRETKPRALSAWNYAEGEHAASGPEWFERLDVGRVLMVGAGAVAAALVYWLYGFGVTGEWTIVDGDIVELHNTNRGLVFTPRHADWPQLRRDSAAKKAELLAALIPRARAFSAWYDECAPVREQFDLVLALANDRNVRHLIASRNAPVTLHATTGTSWLSQLHRHIPGRDDCVACRVGEVQTPVFGCSTAEITRVDGTSSDAALPFLSAASGLMLATALQRLQYGELAEGARNDWRWDFDSLFRMATSGVRGCRESCRLLYPARLRREINAGTRWAALELG
jgi:molybdopterin/thiamine biosynthesis adenylyltransferase